MASDINVKCGYYATGDVTVKFYFYEIDPKKSDTDAGYIKSYYYDMAMNLYMKFKDQPIKITVEKM